MIIQFVSDDSVTAPGAVIRLQLGMFGGAQSYLIGLKSLFWPNINRSQTKRRKGNVFTGVYLSTGGRGVSLGGGASLREWGSPSGGKGVGTDF